MRILFFVASIFFGIAFAAPHKFVPYGEGSLRLLIQDTNDIIANEVMPIATDSEQYRDYTNRLKCLLGAIPIAILDTNYYPSEDHHHLLMSDVRTTHRYRFEVTDEDENINLIAEFHNSDNYEDIIKDWILKANTSVKVEKDCNVRHYQSLVACVKILKQRLDGFKQKMDHYHRDHELFWRHN